MSDVRSLRARARALAEQARAAARRLLASTAQERTRALWALAEEVGSAAVREQMALANAADVAAARAVGQTPALVDRLVLDPPRLAALARAIGEIAAQPDPVGEVVEHRVRPSGLVIERVRAPLGTVLMIYEARPNVTADAAALCLRSGNAALLRGGAEARRSNEVLVQAVQRALRSAGLPEAAVQLVPPERALLEPLLQLEELIDLCIPRGGPSLIRFIAQTSRIPVIKHYQGVCHLYLAADAEVELAVKLALNGKAQRPGVCNALECVLVDAAAAPLLVPPLARALAAAGVELRCDPRALPLARAALLPAGPAPQSADAAADAAARRLDDLLAAAGVRRAATAGATVAAIAEDYGAEFLDYKLLLCVVDGPEAALAHVARWGSRHTESICTRDPQLAERFVREVDASCVLVNASSRFNDGGELGLGAEIGISTSKLHAYGPMGARELTCTRFVVRGSGQVRT